MNKSMRLMIHLFERLGLVVIISGKRSGTSVLRQTANVIII